MRKIVLLSFLALLFAGNAGVAAACSCFGAPSVCGSYRAADAVFVGSVQRIELPRPQKGEDGEERVAGQIAYVRVEKVFKGMKSSRVVFRTEGTSCDTVYTEGQRRLFYAYYDKKTRRWGTRPCDRNALVEHAADDLLYLQGLPASARKTRISGALKHYEDDPAGGSKLVRAIVGARVTIRGEGRTYEVYTDENGVYEIYGLPPGKYVIEPEPPPGLRLYFTIEAGEVDNSERGETKLVLGQKGCAGVDFIYSPDTGVSRAPFGPDGRALPGVCLRPLPKE